ncbi:uncharacterized protein LOC141691293 [Apium graveolens]|uniref:uncharacterized protein LOC141691293 n=1 Tax=Apium graveolens TaxID=4045 RepID=UPI003D79AB9C
MSTIALYSSTTIGSTSKPVIVDSNHLYYLHPSDNPGMQLITVVLTESNYNHWQRCMNIALSSKLKLGFVDGSYTKPAANAPLLVHWLRCNNMITSWILNSVTEEIRNSIVYMETARAIWLDLERSMNSQPQTPTFGPDSQWSPFHCANTVCITDNKHFVSQVHSISGNLPQNKWIIDTGATDHITPFMSLLTNAQSSDASLQLPISEISPVTHVDNIQLNSNITLQNVLYVPSFTYNLLSVSKLLQDTSYHITFLSNSCFLQGQQWKTGLEIGKLENGLYILIDSIAQQTAKSTFEKSKSKCYLVSNDTVHFNAHVSSIDTWHARLGHAPAHVIQLLPVVSQTKIMDTCNSCFFSMQSRLRFPDSQHTSEKLFDLVHADVWGPYRIPTHGNCRWFLTLVEDKSRSVCRSEHFSVQNQKPNRSKIAVLEIPYYNAMRVFGSLCYATILPKPTDKFATRAIKGVFLGYPYGQKGYKVLNLDTRRVIVSRDVHFLEHIFPFKELSAEEPPAFLFTSSEMFTADDPLTSTESIASSIDPTDATVQFAEAGTESERDSPSSKMESPTESNQTFHVTVTENTCPVSVTSSRPTRVKKLPAKFTEFTGFPSHLISSVSQTDENADILLASQHYKQAVQEPEWCAAMGVELAALEANQTWEIVPLPPNKKVVGCIR